MTSPPPDRARRLLVPLLAFLFGLAALATAAYVTLMPRPQQSAAGGIGGPFRLVSHEGRPATEQDFRGRPHLVFFGFTHCPDVCPTTLFQISEVLKETGPAGRDLRALFVSVDPQRDTPEILKQYLASFDERIVGLTGDPAAVDATVRAYRAYARKVPLKEGDYTMEHTSLVYLMGKDGAFVGSFNLSRPPGEAAAELRRAL